MSDDYKVGYGKPPKHSQFPPGVSGNKGRRKPISETHREIVARIRDEMVEVGGKKVSKFELSIISVVNNTIKSGKPRDLKLMIELLDKYGALPVAEATHKSQLEGNWVEEKLMNLFYRTHDIDPADPAAIAQDSMEEAGIILACKSCQPILKERWSNPERKSRKKRFGCTNLQKQIEEFFSKRK